MGTLEELLSEHNHLVAVDSETTYGEDAFDGSEPSEFVAFRQFDFDTEIGIVEDERERATHSGREHDTYDDSASVSWEVPFTGIVDPEGTPALPIGALLKAGNLAETVEATPPAFKYHPVTGSNMSEVPSATFVHYMIEGARGNARKMVFTGLRGNRTITLEMGEVALLSGDDTGLYAEFPTNTVSKPSEPSTYHGEEHRFVVVGMDFELDGVNYPIESLEIQTNWDVNEERDAVTAETTLSGVFLSRSAGSRMEGSTTVKGRSSTIENILPAIRAGDAFSLNTTLKNPNGDRLQLSAPAVQFGNYSANRDGHIHFDVPLYLNADDGEDELEIVIDRD